jgi:hypothetical protein
MKITRKFLPRALAFTALIGTFALANPVCAANDSAMPTAMHESDAHEGHRGGSIDKRIAMMHDKLVITAAQEGQWKKVASAMRESDGATKTLMSDRRENAKTMTALENLESYKRIMQSRVEGIDKVMEPLKVLYVSLNDTQKKLADDVFGHFNSNRREAHKKKMMSMKPPARTETKIAK